MGRHHFWFSSHSLVSPNTTHLMESQVVLNGGGDIENIPL